MGIPAVETGLKQAVLSGNETIAQSIALIAPTAGPLLTIPLVFASAGTGTWLAFVIATLTILLVALNINQFARVSASPGSLYSYISSHMHPAVGMLGAWSLLIAYIGTAVAIAAGLTNYTNVLLKSMLGIQVPPIVLGALGVGLAVSLAYRDVRISARLMLGLEVISVTLISILGAGVLFRHGFHPDMGQLTLKGVTADKLRLGLVLAIFASVGFESATSLGAEAKDPLRNIPRAVKWSGILAGLFFILCAYTEVLGFHGSKESLETSLAPMHVLARQAGLPPVLGLLIDLGALVSFFSCVLACLTAGARVLFLMGQKGAVHSLLGRAHSSNQTPHRAVVLSGLAVFVPLAILSWRGVAPLDVYGLLGTLATFGFLTAYILVCVAAPIFLRSEGRLATCDAVVSLLALLTMGMALLGNIYPVPPAPYSYLPYCYLGLLISGLAWSLVLNSRKLVNYAQSASMRMVLVIALAIPLCIKGQSVDPSSADDSAISTLKTEEGIPVNNQLVIDKCSGCHTRDAKGNMLRISYERATPEGWEEAVKRMMRLRGLVLAPSDARSIVKYLSSSHGLAPEEAAAVTNYNEKRIVDETNIPNDGVRGACASCHPFARPMSWRRTAGDWKYLANLHIALYPQADEAFRFGLRAGDEGGEGVSEKTVPLEDALSFLGKSAPLQTPEWAAWRARMRAPKLAGRWLVSAEVPGKGRYYGEMLVEPSGSAEDEFTTRVTLKSARDGSTLTRSGQSLIYTGYAWRGHSKGESAPGTSPDDLSRDMREVMSVSTDQSSAQGRWFWGQYQEFGVDVNLRRATSEPVLVGVDKLSLKAGSTANRVRLIGDNLPDNPAISDFDFGSGVTVDKIVTHSAGDVTLDLSVSGDALCGRRDIAFRRSVLPRAIAVFDHVDYIRVSPESALARLGSERHPKGFQQFEAVGYQRGEDGKLHTADDVELGPVNVTWSVEEFYSAYGDDDKKFIGTLSVTGLFSPASDGPNPKRQFSRNNYGDVWVVATAQNDKDKSGKPLVGKSYLVVTVPAYMLWDQPEVGQ